MSTRREFLATATLAALAGPARAATLPVTPRAPTRGERFDPWIEVDAEALRHNVRAVHAHTGTPILAMVKNNAYGLGNTLVGRVFADMPEVIGLASVRPSEALALRAAGVRKPLSLLAVTTDDDAEALARADVRLSLWLPDHADRMARLAARLGRPVAAELAFDADLGREGIPWHRAAERAVPLATHPAIRIAGSWTIFGNDLADSGRQLACFHDACAAVTRAGGSVGLRHVAPSQEALFLPAAWLDAVRPLSALLGITPTSPAQATVPALRIPMRLCAGIVRLEQFRRGDAIFRPNWIADRETWIATLPIGQADGYPGTALGNCRVFIGGRTYPLVGAIGSSHCMVELGETCPVRIGDRAVLIGPDAPEVHPATIAKQSGLRAAGNLFRRLSALLPRELV